MVFAALGWTASVCLSVGGAKRASSRMEFLETPNKPILNFPCNAVGRGAGVRGKGGQTAKCTADRGIGTQAGEGGREGGREAHFERRVG